MNKTLKVGEQHLPGPETQVCLVGFKKNKKVCEAGAEFEGGIVGNGIRESTEFRRLLSRLWLLLGGSSPKGIEFRGMTWPGFCCDMLTSCRV